MSGPSQIGNSPAVPPETDPATDNAPAANSPSAKIKPGYWGTPSSNECDKAYSACEKEVEIDLARVKADRERYLSDLYCKTPISALPKDYETFLKDKDKLRDDVAKLLAASVPDGLVLSKTDAQQIGEILKAKFSDAHDLDNFPERFISEAVDRALQSRFREQSKCSK